MRHQNADSSQWVRLLCTRSERPNGCRSHNNVDEIASPHVHPKGSEQGIVAGQTGRLEVDKTALGDLRFGSKADIGARPINVPFTPKADIGTQLCDVCFVPKADIT
jgi:hypothetical protein